MNMVMALVAKGATAIASSATAGASSGVYSALGKTGSALSALSTFALGQQKALESKNAAFEASLAERDEFINAQDKANAINDKYGDIAGAQLAAAGANGVDLQSGGLTAARAQARQNADNDLNSAWGQAQTRGYLYRAKALALKASAGAASTTGILAAASQLATSFGGGA